MLRSPRIAKNESNTLILLSPLTFSIIFIIRVNWRTFDSVDLIKGALQVNVWEKVENLGKLKNIRFEGG